MLTQENISEITVDCAGHCFYLRGPKYIYMTGLWREDEQLFKEFGIKCN